MEFKNDDEFAGNNFGGIGGGDVKLMGALGAWLGTSVMLGVAFYTSLAGGVLAIVLIVRHGYAAQASHGFGR